MQSCCPRWNRKQCPQVWHSEVGRLPLDDTCVHPASSYALRAGTQGLQFGGPAIARPRPGVGIAEVRLRTTHWALDVDLAQGSSAHPPVECPPGAGLSGAMQN